MVNPSNSHVVVIALDKPEAGKHALISWLSNIDKNAMAEQLPSGRYRVTLRFDQSNHEFVNLLKKLEGCVYASVPTMAAGDPDLIFQGSAHDEQELRLQKTAASTVRLASF